jgi:prepilin-type N-terminal cleavage/methylation domain-containing protein
MSNEISMLKIKKNLRGFTLIELLVVVAIAVILVTVVLVSLSNARQKAKVATFKTQATSVRTKAVLACDNSTIMSYDDLISALGTLPLDMTVSRYPGGVPLDCKSGSGIFDLKITTTTTADCYGQAKNSGVVFFGSATGC